MWIPLELQESIKHSKGKEVCFWIPKIHAKFWRPKVSFFALGPPTSPQDGKCRELPCSQCEGVKNMKALSVPMINIEPWRVECKNVLDLP